MNKLPWFQFYPADFVNDIIEMDDEQAGMYIRLLCFQWINGSLPTDTGKLMGMVSRPYNFDTNWNEVLSSNFVKKEGRFYNERLEKEREKKIKFFKQASIKGKAGAKKRWKKNSRPYASANGVGNGESNGQSIAIQTSKVLESRDSNNLDSDSNNIKPIQVLYVTFLEFFNELKDSQYKGCSKSRKAFGVRIKEGYTLEQFKTAIQNAYKDPYHIETEHTHLTPEFITRGGKLEKYLNSKKSDKKVVSLKLHNPNEGFL